MTSATRLPLALLGVVSAMLFAGVLVWSNTPHLSCDDSGEGVVRGMVLLARWGGLGAGVIALAAAWVASARARRRPPSFVFTAVCAAAAASAFVACAAPHTRLVPFGVVLVPATLAVLFYALPALVILGLALGATSFFPAEQRRLRGVQLVALWFAFVLVPGCAGVGLISQYPVCLG